MPAAIHPPPSPCPSPCNRQVGIHELLGHGSGKLYHADTPDAAALVASQLAHPVSGAPITGPFYAPGATWDTTFGKIASPYATRAASSAASDPRSSSAQARTRHTPL